MLSREEHKRVYEHAYVPEHLPEYVQAVSGAEPFLHDDYLYFIKKSHLLFIGYPLSGETSDTREAYQTACKRFRPETVAIIAPEIWLPAQSYEASQPPDNYYRLDLPLGSLNREISYMIRRAAREVQVGQETFGEEHQKLVKGFLSERTLSREHEYIFSRIPHYMMHSTTARLLAARKEGELVAFSVVDLGSARYGFYLFNFRSTETYVPGASDLLCHEMVQLAQSEGKVAFNLGLGIHSGVRRFKEKWGATPFLQHASAIIRRKPSVMETLLGKL